MRILVRGCVALALAVSAAGCSCADNPPNPPLPPVPVGLGLGGACLPSTACRDGLACSDGGVCIGGRTLADGTSCTVGDECQSGRCGPGASGPVCVSASPDAGVTGASCKGDNDCAFGLRCGFDGVSLFPRCLPSGNLDVGGTCTSNVGCAQGLYCVSGACAKVPVPPDGLTDGLPPFLPDPAHAWKGASCPTDKTTGSTALWNLPRATDPADVQQDFFRLPFPNDAARGADGGLDFSRFPKDPSPVFGFDALGRYLAVLAPEKFGGYGTVTFRFDGAIDFATVTLSGTSPQVRFVDLTPGTRFGQRRGLSFQGSSQGNHYVCNHWVAVRPYPGDPMPEGVYAVVLMKGIKDKAGADVQVSPDFTAMLQATAPTDPVQAAAWPLYAPLRAWLTQASIPVSDVVSASVFSVGNPRALVEQLALAQTTGPAVTDEGWVKCGGSIPSPCPDATGPRACGSSTTVDEWHALLDLPIFQRGTAPYLTPADDGSIDVADGGLVPVRTEKVCAALTIPKGTPPDAGWPVVLYAHGTGGSFRGHAGDGAAETLTSIAFADGGVAPQVAVLGFDQVGHGPRRGARTDVSPDDIVFNFGNPASARGTMAQGAADLHGVARYLKTLDGPAKGLPKLDASHLAFWGHSQGATEGALFLGTDRTVDGALLSGASASITDALLSKRSPVDIAGGLWLALSESSPAEVHPFHPVLSLLQTWIDPVDPVNFAQAVVVTPSGGGAPAHARHVFQVWGTGDTFTAQPVQSTFAVTTGLWLVGPQLEPSFDGVTVHPFVGGNVTVPRNVTAAVRQYAPASGDGHFVVYSNPTARTDAARFLGRVLLGEVPVVPE